VSGEQGQCAVAAATVAEAVSVPLVAAAIVAAARLQNCSNYNYRQQQRIIKLLKLKHGAHCSSSTAILTQARTGRIRMQRTSYYYQHDHQAVTNYT
jgi:hypothetical protein